MTHEELRAKALARPEVRQEYEALEPEFELLRRMLQARKLAGLTQDEVAARMGTKRSAVARLESTLAAGKHSPSVATLQKYAQAVGSKLDIRFLPEPE
jgi:transcriptional regulator with XRE-family HTH domain